MRTALRLFAVVLAIAALACWAALGANRGWTKTSVPVKHTDEITGITVDQYQKRFVPGVDLLGAALLGAGFLAGVSFFVNKNSANLTNP